MTKVGEGTISSSFKSIPISFGTSSHHLLRLYDSVACTQEGVSMCITYHGGFVCYLTMK